MELAFEGMEFIFWLNFGFGMLTCLYEIRLFCIFGSENCEGDINAKVISSVPALKKAVHLSEMQLGQQGNRKAFRLEWLDIPEFKDWLSPDLDSPYKARCLACSRILNAGKSELEKHAVGAKHGKAVETLKQILEQQNRNEAYDTDEGNIISELICPIICLL
jgi:hypothetical protein